MDKEFIMATAKTIEQQILWSINKWEYLSWGISRKVATEYEGMATLALRVSGAVHKGWVFISLNEGKDCYEVRLLNVARNKVKRMLEEVYCDNLGAVLDGLIERKTEWTDEQYKKKAARDSARKLGMEVLDASNNNSKTKKTMAKNEVKFRPATMAEIEGRDVNLYMNGEQVWVMVVHRSETVGEGEAKVDYIMLTNAKKVQVEDLQVIDNNNNEPEEDKTMATKKNESANVQNAQVKNETIDVNVGEVTVDSIMPVMQPVEGTEYNVQSDGKAVTFGSMAPNLSNLSPDPSPKGEGSTKQEVAEAICKAANGGKATTMPLGSHGTLVVGGCGFTPKTTKSGKPRDRFDLEKDKSKVTLKRKTPQVSSIDHSPFLDKPSGEAERTIDHSPSSLPRVTLVVYTTKRGEQAPRIEGFGGENDPRWKRHYDDKVRLAQQKKEADKFNEKLQAQMKGKSKDEREKLRKQWKSVGSDPFGASYFTDRTTGDKYYQMTMGAKYMDVARELVDAYNRGDEQAIAAAEQAVIDCKNGIVQDIEAQRDAKRAEREAQKSEKSRVKSEELATAQAAAPAMSAEDAAMFDLFKKFMAGDKDAMAKVGAVLNKAA